MPEVEFKEMFKAGSIQQIKIMEQENNQLKDCLFMLQ